MAALLADGKLRYHSDSKQLVGKEDQVPTLLQFYIWRFVDQSLQKQFLEILVLVIFLLIAVQLVVLFYKITFAYILLRRPMVLLELTPSVASERSPLATAKLFMVLHGLQAARPILDKLLFTPESFSIEIVSSGREGIRFLLRIPRRKQALFERAITAYASDLHIQQIEDYVPIGNKKDAIKIGEFELSSYFAYPLASPTSLDQHDPVSYITSALADLTMTELVALQIVLTPAHSTEAYMLRDKLLRNEMQLRNLDRPNLSRSTLGQISSKILFALTEIITEVTHGPTNIKNHQQLSSRHQSPASNLKPARTLSKLEQGLVEAVSEKLNQPLFAVKMRCLAITPNQPAQQDRMNELRQALAPLSTAHQSLILREDGWKSLFKNFWLFSFRSRLPPLRIKHNSILSVSEVATLYHFPARMNSNEQVVRALSKTLPVPLAVKRYADAEEFDVILGSNTRNETFTPIGLTEQERARHLYIIGGTGSGKTTMLQYTVVQDMQHDKGVAVIDPHGDMAEVLLKHVPPKRLNDVIYFNPDDLLHPIGLNLLELKPGLKGVELLREKDMVTETVISVFRKIFSDEDSGGHRVEYILRNAIQTALCTEEPTLFTIFRLLNNPGYRKRITDNLEDEDLKAFWKHEFGKAGEFQRVKMAAGITSKIGRFLFSASAKQILEQPVSTIDFDNVIDSGKILICNLSKGLIGEDTSELMGILILAKLQLAALRRARIRQETRRPFYVYVDEFQNFATPSFAQLLSEARKYKLYVTIAEQSTSQQKDQRMVQTILANVGTIICFRTGNPHDENVLLPLFAPYVVRGEIANLPAFRFYAKFSGIHAQEPLSGQTLLLSQEGTQKTAVKAIALSRKNFTRKRVDAAKVAHRPSSKQ